MIFFEKNKRLLIKLVSVLMLIGLVVFSWIVFIRPRLEIRKLMKEEKKREKEREEKRLINRQEHYDWLDTLPEPQKELFQEKSNEKEYKENYVQSIKEDDSELEEIQVRGKVKSFDNKVLLIDAIDKEYAIGLLREAIFYCIPEMMPTPNGKMMSTKEAMIDFSKYRDSGFLYKIADIQKQIYIGDDVVVEAEIDEEAKMTAIMISGYGCEMERGLSL